MRTILRIWRLSVGQFHAIANYKLLAAFPARGATQEHIQKMIRAFSVGLMALWCAVILNPSASAAPTKPLTRIAPAPAAEVHAIHWRAYRHCHDRGRRIRCHGGYVRPYRQRYGVAPYGYRYANPGMVLRFGSGPRNRYGYRRWR